MSIRDKMGWGTTYSKPDIEFVTAIRMLQIRGAFGRARLIHATTPNVDVKDKGIRFDYPGSGFIRAYFRAKFKNTTDPVGFPQIVTFRIETSNDIGGTSRDPANLPAGDPASWVSDAKTSLNDDARTEWQHPLGFGFSIITLPQAGGSYPDTEWWVQIPLVVFDIIGLGSRFIATPHKNKLQLRVTYAQDIEYVRDLMIFEGVRHENTPVVAPATGSTAPRWGPDYSFGMNSKYDIFAPNSNSTPTPN